MRSRTLLFALVVVLIPTLQTACSSSAATSQHEAPTVLADVKAICPLNVVYVSTPRACQFARVWNATTPSFKTPRRTWGVAYAFNCGSRPRQFRVDTRLTAMDHMGVPGEVTHARHGRGYFMISGRTMKEMIKAVPPEYKADAGEIAVVIASRCTWHVKAILGSRKQVAAAIPPVPAMMAEWWRKGHSK